MVCMRFSACSKAMLYGDSKTSSVTSTPHVMPNASAICFPSVVLVSLGEAAVVCERKLSIEEFFVAYRKTALQPGEVLKTILASVKGELTDGSRDG